MKKILLDREQVDKCPICGGEGVSLGAYSFDKKAYINVDACVACHSLYHNPRMTKESMFQFYGDGLYRQLSPYKNTSEINRISHIQKLMAQFGIKPKRCLDVGCSRGYLLKYIQSEYKAEILGLDPWAENPIIKEFVRNKEDVQGMFDTIFCVHTLEHMHDPIEELQWMKDHLTQDGTLYIECPIEKEVSLEHGFVFSPKAFDIMMEKAGFSFVWIALGEDRREPHSCVLIARHKK